MGEMFKDGRLLWPVNIDDRSREYRMDVYRKLKSSMQSDLSLKSSFQRKGTYYEKYVIPKGNDFTFAEKTSKARDRVPIAEYYTRDQTSLHIFGGYEWMAHNGDDRGAGLNSFIMRVLQKIRG